MDRLRPRAQLGGRARGEPARVHEQRVVEQGVHRAHGEEGGRHVVQLGVERRDVRVAARLLAQARQEHVAEVVQGRRGEDEIALAPQALAGRHRQVEAAVDEIRRGEGAGDRVAVAQAQEGDGAEVPARRVAADRRHGREAKRLEAVAQEPQRRVLAVVARRRIGVLGRQAVVDAHRAQAGGVGQLDEQRVLEIGRAQRPPAAVDVQVGAHGRLLGGDHPQPQPAGAALDRDVPRAVGQEGRRREDAAALPALPARDLDGHLVRRWVGGELALELCVERPRLGEHVIGHGGHGPIL